MVATTENYQLKWNAFGTHLHSCVAGAMSSRQFTDVCLATMDGFQISAHRFVLSACSQYIHDILKLHYNAITSSLCPIIIILPSEINSKSLKVLMEYMYSGKANVSNDVLENVLRGGDLLKIKGLWRPDENTEEYHTRVKTSEKLYQSTPSNQGIQDIKRTKCKNMSTTCETVKMSPPISETHISRSTYNLPKKAVRHSSVITSMNKCSNTTTKDALMMEQKQFVQTNTVDVLNKNSTDATPSAENPTQQLHSDNNGERQAKITVKEEPIEYSEMDDTDMGIIHDSELGSPTATNNITCNDTPTELTIKPEIMFAGDDDDEDMQEAILASTIREDNAPLLSSIPYVEIPCKLPAHSSVIMVEKHECTAPKVGELYTPLMCELCSESFTLPKDWVKHVQTHTDMMPAKRQRRGRNSSEEESSNMFPALLCDLCQTYFPTPAEWVQHIERSHTVTELRFSNLDKSSETNCTCLQTKSSFKSNSAEILLPLASTSGQQKECPDCRKSFPSHASMMIHSRTHTGERPYNCDYCFKGFNVKSNLLRHLRTLHDKIINSTEIENKEISNI